MACTRVMYALVGTAAVCVVAFIIYWSKVMPDPTFLRVQESRDPAPMVLQAVMYGA